MMKVNSKNPWVTIFRWITICLIALLAVQVLLLLWQMTSNANNTVGDMLVDADQISDIKQSQDIETLSEIVDRTLFSWNRKPVTSMGPEGTTASSGGILASKWRLTGLVNTPDSTYAVFSEVDGERRVRLESGMDLDNWSVKNLDTEQVTLASGDDTVVLRLSVTDTPQLETERMEIQDMDIPEAASKSDNGETKQ